MVKHKKPKVNGRGVTHKNRHQPNLQPQDEASSLVNNSLRPEDLLPKGLDPLGYLDELGRKLQLARERSVRVPTTPFVVIFDIKGLFFDCLVDNGPTLGEVVIAIVQNGEVSLPRKKSFIKLQRS